MGKYSLLMVAGFLLVFGITRRNLNQTNAALLDNYTVQFEQREAKFAAWSVANVALAALREDWDSTNAVIGPVNIGGAEAETTVEVLADDRFLITASGRVESAQVLSGEIEDQVEVIVEQVPVVPAHLNSAVAANADVDINGTVRFDGRDHDLDGNMIPGLGSFAFSLPDYVNFIQQGNSDYAGTCADGVDYDYGDGTVEKLVERRSGMLQHLPSSPDALLGLPEGTLKQMAIANGRYYTDDFPEPGDIGQLSGVTYIETDEIIPLNLGQQEGHSGVLVVRNATGTSVVKNLLGGSFEGLIIVDEIVHFNLGQGGGPPGGGPGGGPPGGGPGGGPPGGGPGGGSPSGGGLLGTLVSLAETTSEGHLFGVGNGVVKFSRLAISTHLEQIGTGGVNVQQWWGYRVAGM